MTNSLIQLRKFVSATLVGGLIFLLLNHFCLKIEIVEQFSEQNTFVYFIVLFGLTIITVYKFFTFK